MYAFRHSAFVWWWFSSFPQSLSRVRQSQSYSVVVSTWFAFLAGRRSNSRTISWWSVCGNISTPAASFNTNGRPRSDFEHGRLKSIQFFSAACGAQEMYTNRFRPFAFRMASFDGGSVGGGRKNVIKVNACWNENLSTGNKKDFVWLTEASSRRIDDCEQVFIFRLKRHRHNVIVAIAGHKCAIFDSILLGIEVGVVDGFSNDLNAKDILAMLPNENDWNDEIHLI